MIHQYLALILDACMPLLCIAYLALSVLSIWISFVRTQYCAIRIGLYILLLGSLQIMLNIEDVFGRMANELAGCVSLRSPQEVMWEAVRSTGLSLGVMINVTAAVIIGMLINISSTFIKKLMFKKRGKMDE